MDPRDKFCPPRWLSLCSLCLGLLLLGGCPTDGPLDQDDQGGEDTPDSSSMDMSRADMGPSTGDQGGDMPPSATLAISSISPTQGPLEGGTPLTINGSGFAPGAQVTLDGRMATNVQVRSATQITATSPAVDAELQADLEVINPDGSRVKKSAAFSYRAGVMPETELYCRLQAQSPVNVVLGRGELPSLYTLIYAKDRTSGPGKGAGVIAELGVGQGASYESYAFSSMAYNVDKDGLTPGDLANDEYGLAPSVSAPGSYRYIARVKVEGSTEPWLYCDLDGSDNGVQSEQLGVIEATEPAPPMISYCQLSNASSPLILTAGQQSPVLSARLFASGVTQGACQGPNIEAELGYGAPGAALDALDYVAMSYRGDVDGLSPGDAANDAYGATLLIPDAGDYRYIARVRVSQPVGEWFYCDRDGHDDGDPFEIEEAGVLEVVAPAQPTIGYCQTETLTRSTRPNMASQAITARVYALGITDAAGAGANVTAELVWGDASADPATWTNDTTAVYLEDADGLVAGDLANDRYTATITSAQEGDFGYAYRFSLDGGNTWSWCDTDGSDGTEDGFEAGKVGSLSVQSANLPDACRIQFPAIKNNGVVGAPVEVFGRVTEAGVTDVQDDAATIKAELWVGPTTASVASDAALFEKVVMAYNSQPTGLGAGEDEYQGSWTPSAAGSYKFVVRFSVDGGATFSSCDLDGGVYEPNKAGVIIAHANAPDLIDYCRVFQGQVSHARNDPNLPIFTAEVYEQGLTDAGSGGANSAQLEAEVGYGSAGNNPALSGAFLWQPAPFSQLNPGNANNYEYQGNPYTAALLPASGFTYDVVIRVRESGQSDAEWAYCDNFPGTMDFLPAYASKLTVTH